MQELFIPHRDLKLCVQTFGNATDPAVVLITGAAGQGILWNQILCKDLAKAGYFVIRFDHRDTGLSSGIDFDLSPYNLKDMAEDILSILDYFHIKKAHYVGMSMGGYIAQFAAIHFPKKVLTLSLLMTTINSLAMRGVRGIHNLPGQDLRVVKQLSEMYQMPRSTLEDRIKTLVSTWELFNGFKAEFSYDEWYPLAEESYRRAKTKSAVRNHRLAVLNSPADRTQMLKTIDLPPTLIIHGAADPIIQVPHAHYGHKQLPQTKLLVIEKMGHLLSSVFISEIEDALLNHFSSSK